MLVCILIVSNYLNCVFANSQLEQTKHTVAKRCLIFDATEDLHKYVSMLKANEQKLGDNAEIG